MAQLPVASKLTLMSDLTEDDFVSVKSAFDSQQHWNEKNIVGNSDPEAERTLCIRVVNRIKRFRGLRSYQAAWWITNGPFDTDEWEISHICTSETSGYSGCINVLHMRLETKKMNMHERRKHQDALRKFRNNTRSTWPKDKQGPLYLTTIGHEKNCEHKFKEEDGARKDDENDEGYPEYPCFMNIHTINKKETIKGQRWFEEPKWTEPKILPKAADDDEDDE